MAEFNWAQYEEKPDDSFDWNKYTEESFQPEESKGLSGVATDALAKALQAVYGIPSAVMRLPGEAYGAGQQIFKQPTRVTQNIGAGFGELGHGILSAPGNVRDYLVRKDLLSEQSPGLRLPENILPKDYNYAEALGAEGNQAGDELLRGIPSGIASLPFAEKLFTTAREIPLTKKLAARPLEEAKNLIGHRKINKIPVSKDILKEAKEFLPKSTPYKNLLKQAQNGNYNTLFTLQSDLGKSARELTKSASGAERLHGMQASDLRHRLLDSIKQNLSKQGHSDISDLITKGQNKYRQHMKYRPIAESVIKKATYGIPGAFVAKKIYDLK